MPAVSRRVKPAHPLHPTHAQLRGRLPLRADRLVLSMLPPCIVPAFTILRVTLRNVDSEAGSENGQREPCASVRLRWADA